MITLRLKNIAIVAVILGTALVFAGCARNLLIDSSPRGAAVFVDDRYSGDTPKVLLLNPGTYQVRLEKPGYARYVGSVELSNQQESLAVPLQKLAGILEVRSNQQGIEVLLDGERLGTLDQEPLRKADLAIGTHVVKASKPGHRQWEQAVSIEEGKVTLVVISLAPVRVSGMLRVIANENPAEVSIRDTTSGMKRILGFTPLEKEVPAGTYELEVTKDGFNPWTDLVDVTTGSTTEKRATLRPRRFNLSDQMMLAGLEPNASDADAAPTGKPQAGASEPQQGKKNDSPAPSSPRSAVKLLFKDLETVKKIFQDSASPSARYVSEAMEIGDTVAVRSGVGCRKSRDGADPALERCLGTFFSGTGGNKSLDSSQEKDPGKMAIREMAVDLYEADAKKGAGVVLSRFDLRRPAQALSQALEAARGRQLVMATIPGELTDDAKRLTVPLSGNDATVRLIAAGPKFAGALKDPGGNPVRLQRAGSTQRARIQRPRSGFWTLEWKKGTPPFYVLVTAQRRIPFPIPGSYALKQGEKIVLPPIDGAKGYRIERLSIIDEQLDPYKIAGYETTTETGFPGKVNAQMEIGPVLGDGTYNRIWRLTLKDTAGQVTQRQLSASYVVGKEKIATEGRDLLRR